MARINDTGSFPLVAAAAELDADDVLVIVVDNVQKQLPKSVLDELYQSAGSYQPLDTGLSQIAALADPDTGTGTSTPRNPLLWYNNAISSYDFLELGSELVIAAGTVRFTPTDGNTLYVSTLGNDSTAQVDSPHLPYLTLSAAKTAASSGDTIHVLPGSYTGDNLLKNGVNWHFESGAVVTLTTGAGGAIFDDSATGANTAITCKITGAGSFVSDHPRTGSHASIVSFWPKILLVAQASSDVLFRFDQITLSYSAVTSGSVHIGIWQETGRVTALGNKISTTASSPVYWINGEFHGEIVEILADDQCYEPLVYIVASGVQTGQFYLRSDLVYNRATDAGGGAPDVIEVNGEATARIWLDILQIKSDGAGAVYLNGPYVYLRSQKIGVAANDSTDIMAISSVGSNGNYYIEVDKVEGGSSAKAPVSLQGGNSWIRIKELTNLNSFATALRVLNAGTHFVSVTDCKAGGITVSTGTLNLSASNIIGNVSRSSGTLTLSDCAITGDLSGTLNKRGFVYVSGSDTSVATWQGAPPSTAISGLGTLATQSGTFSGTSSGTNTGDVTLSGTPTYITIAGQVITRGLVTLTTDVTGILPPANMGTGSSITTKYLRGDGTWQTISGGGDALTSGTLAQFAATTSLELKGVLSDETGSGALVFATSPTLVTPLLGTPTSGVLSSCTGLPLTTGVTGVLPHGNLGTGGGGSTKFLREDSTYQTVSAGSITGADTRVLFFDGTDSPAGDAGLTYNKTTNVMTAHGGVVLGDGTNAGAITVTAPGSGAGNNATVTASAASSGNTNGGNVVITPGLKAGAGSDGVVVVKALSVTPGGNLQEWQSSTGGVIARIVPSGEEGTFALVNSVYSIGHTFTTGGLALGYNMVAYQNATVDMKIGTGTAGTLGYYNYWHNGVTASGWRHGLYVSGGTYNFVLAAGDYNADLSTGQVLNVGHAITDVFAIYRPVTAQFLVEANTAGSGSPNILTVGESRTLLTNEGSTAKNYHTLPSAAAGLEFSHAVQDGDGMRIVANTGDTISVAGTVSASAGYVESTAIGSAIRLVAINATEWVALAVTGVWNVDGTAFVLPPASLGTGASITTKYLRGDSTWQTISGGGDALTSGSLAQFAATTSLELKTLLSDETGSGAAVFATSPTLVTPLLGTPTSGVLTNCTGTASGLTAGTVTTNANLTGAVTSTGNATSQVVASSCFYGTPADGTLTLSAKAAFGFTINQIRGLATSAGTLTLTVKINGTNVTGLASLSVTSTPQDATASAANVVATGDKVTVVIASTSSAANLEFTLKGTR